MQMNITKAYGFKDYIMAGIFILTPFLLKFDAKDARFWIPVSLGGGAIVYSLLTQYELGAIRVIAMPVHLLLDFLGGVLLAVSPWLFGFKNKTFLPHLILGAVEVAITAITTTTLQKRNQLAFPEPHLN